MERIQTSNAPAAIGPYSQAIKANGMLFASGQIAINPETGNIVDGGIESQAHQVLTNIKNLVEAAGLSMCDIVKTTVFMTDISDFATVNGIYAQYFQEPYPARSAVGVKALPKGALIEIEVIAAEK